MDTQLVAQIAAEVAKRLTTFLWSVIAIQSAILLLVTTAGAFVGEYLRGRAKNLATKADFDSLHEQLGLNTRLVERVQAGIDLQDWARREWTTLWRIKLEEILRHAPQCVPTGWLIAAKSLVAQDLARLNDVAGDAVSAAMVPPTGIEPVSSA